MKMINKTILLFFTSLLMACSEFHKVDLETKAGTLDSLENSKELINNLVATCASCHGEIGISNNVDWPNLAGQQAAYLYQQLISFRDGKRQSTVMTGELLIGLSDQILHGIADHYANMPIVDHRPNNNGDELPGAHVRARCVSCHGMTGNTVTGLWPNIAGQQAGYLETQLLNYKNGLRVHPIMQVIANELTEQQIRDVAKYYATQ